MPDSESHEILSPPLPRTVRERADFHSIQKQIVELAEKKFRKAILTPSLQELERREKRGYWQGDDYTGAINNPQIDAAIIAKNRYVGYCLGLMDQKDYLAATAEARMDKTTLHNIHRTVDKAIAQILPDMRYELEDISGDYRRAVESAVQSDLDRNSGRIMMGALRASRRNRPANKIGAPVEMSVKIDVFMKRAAEIVEAYVDLRFHSQNDASRKLNENCFVSVQRELREVVGPLADDITHSITEAVDASINRAVNPGSGCLVSAFTFASRLTQRVIGPPSRG